MSKYTIILSLLALIILSSSSRYNNVMSIDPCLVDSSAYADGEELTYAVYYKLGFAWIPAGEVVFRGSMQAHTYEVEITGKTYPSYNSFFEVDDYFASSIDRRTGLPRSFVRIVHEGSYEKFDSVAFDQVGQVATAVTGKSRSTAKERSLSLDDCMHDMISILYRVRSMAFDDMDRGDRIPISVMFDREVFNLGIMYQGQKKKKIRKLGRHRTHLIEPQVVAGEVFSNDTSMKIYATADANKLPLLIESPVSVGTVMAVLRKATGTRVPHDITRF